MDTYKSNLQNLFNQPQRYEIPPFQREYVWNHENQWGPLWEDVQNMAEQYLETQPSKPTPHFLGAVVLQQRQVQITQLPTRVVVDGQQRLTTLQLLLDAVQEVFEERKYAFPAKRLESLVLNPEEFRNGDSDNAFKVWPTVADRDAFRQAMHNDLASEEYKESRIVRAHEFFKLQTDQWIKAQPEEGEKQAEALEVAVKDLLEVVVIDLDHAEDPHIIFETLNARGTPLLQSDLIKNMVLYEAGANDPDEANRLWGFTDGWWREEIYQGRLNRPRIDVFLNYWLVIRNCEEVNANDVFSVFRRYYQDGNSPIETVAADIGRMGEYYRSLEKADIPDMETFLYRLRVMRAGVLTPVLLWMLSSEVPKQQLQKGFRALESFTVRRMACRITAQSYPGLFVDLLNDLAKSGAERAGDVIVEFLRRQDAYGRLWPSDGWFADALKSHPLYRLLTRGRLRIILEGIEEELRTDKAESGSAPLWLTIEHVMPQQWRDNWPPPRDLEDGRDPEERRNSLIHSVGNLTLVNQPLNSLLSNDPWDKKRSTLEDHTTLFLNKDLLSVAPDVWDESAIEERAKRLCQEAIKVWPHADDINRMTST